MRKISIQNWQNIKTVKFPKFETSSIVKLENDECIYESILPKPTIDNENLVDTIFELIQRAVRLNGDQNFIGEQINDANGSIKYCWLTYNQTFCEAICIGSALQKLHYQSSRIGIAGLNSPRYLTATFALVSYSTVVVPLYHNYKFDDLRQIVNDCELEVIFCDNLNRANEFIKNQSTLQSLKHIIVMDTKSLNFNFDTIAVNNYDLNNTKKIKIYNWDSVLKYGKENPVNVIPPKPEDTYIICHTSGTTGKPKGVELSHCALLTASVGGLYVQWCLPPHNYKFGTDDVYLSFLSPAHSYEQLMQMFVIYVNGKIGIFNGNSQNLINDMKLLRPTLVSLVPRLLDKFRQTIMTEINSSLIVKSVFQLALREKMKILKRGIICYDTIWDKLIFRTFVHRTFGGRLRLITTGGAPITSQTMNFSRTVYGCPVFEGYGQTECCAAGTLSLPGDTTCNHIGGPSPWAQVKLADVLELNYLAKDNQGEVCFRGPALMTRYFNDPKLTSLVIDAQGWLHTGDIGERLPNGCFRIIDRKNHIFKLSQGDFVAPEKIESVYSQYPDISQIFVTGRRTESYLVAIIVVNAGYLALLPKNQSSIEFEKTSLLNNKSQRVKLIKSLQDFGASKGLSSLEQIQNVHCVDVDFTLSNEFVTPTLKLKRSKLNEHFLAIINTLYAEGSLKN